MEGRNEGSNEGIKEGSILFYDALNTFYLRLYDVGYFDNDESGGGDVED